MHTDVTLQHLLEEGEDLLFIIYGSYCPRLI